MRRSVLSCGPRSLGRRVLPFVLLASALSAEPPAGMLRQLGSENYPDRVAARRNLIEWAETRGRDGIVWLLETATAGTDPEVRAGAEEVLRELALRELTRRRPGFVGITMNPIQLQEGAGGGYGIEIQSVEEDSPADRGGLLPGEVIVGLDGERWVAPDAHHRLAAIVGAKRPGDRIELRVLGAEGMREIRLELAPRPWDKGMYEPDARRAGPVPTAEEARERAIREWLREWLAS